MYFFYFDESGSRSPSLEMSEHIKDHIYVVLAVGMYERQWRPFELEISNLKLKLADRLSKEGVGSFELSDCEVKSTWLRNPSGRAKNSKFLSALSQSELQSITDIYFDQVTKRNTVIMASVIDKRHLFETMTPERLHNKAYEFLLERIEHYMRQYHPKHQALIVMDDTSKQLNRSVAMQHALFQRSGNRNMRFNHIVENPFFTRSELSNGVQLADQLAYNVYRCFRDENPIYVYFERMLPHFYIDPNGRSMHGLKVWPESSPLVNLARVTWDKYRENKNKSDVGLG